MRVGSLFTGIGGLDLGLKRAGMTVAWQAETDTYCSQVLAKHWPDVPNLGDVTAVDWESVERVELVCGGFPCQTSSTRSTDSQSTAVTSPRFGTSGQCFASTCEQ